MTTLFVAPAGDRGLNTQLLTGARFLHLRNVFLPINFYTSTNQGRARTDVGRRRNVCATFQSFKSMLWIHKNFQDEVCLCRMDVTSFNWRHGITLRYTARGEGKRQREGSGDKKIGWIENGVRTEQKTRWALRNCCCQEHEKRKRGRQSGRRGGREGRRSSSQTEGKRSPSSYPLHTV